jgi:phenylacetate-CoA ligase
LIVPPLPLQEITKQFSRAMAASQNLPRPETERRQRTLLEKLCRHAHTQVPYYRDTGRLAPLFRKDGAFDLAGWADVPVMTRAEAQANETALHAKKIPPEMLPVSDDRTSGSTGTPLRIKRSFMQTVASHVLFDRAVGWNGCGPVRRLAITDVIDSGSESRSGEPADAQETQLVVPAHLDPAEQIAIVERTRPSHIIAFPNLVEAWLETGDISRLSGIRAIFSTGEVLSLEARERIAQQLGCPVINLYSSTETGPIAIGGPDRGLRISEEIMLLEQPGGPIDPSRPVQVVVTPFYAYAMPLIRYTTGDYIRYSSRTPREAIGLRRLEAVLGRERSLFRRRDGTRIWPAVHGDVIGDIVPLRGWQLVQETLDDIVLRIVTPGGLTAEAATDCREALAKMVPGFNIRVERVDKIEDDRATGKRFESCVSLVA